MPAVVFIVDTSASMATVDFPASSVWATGPRLSRLDGAKAVIETFLRQNQRAHPEPPQFLLVEAAATGARLVCSFGASKAKVEAELKVLATPVAATPPGALSAGEVPPPSLNSGPLNGALAMAFTLLARYRLILGVDCCGGGRPPWALDPGCVLLVSDGAAHRLPDGKVQLPNHSRRDSDVCGAPFRWDQRLFTIAVGGGATPLPLVLMTDATGGKHWVAGSLTDAVAAGVAAAAEFGLGGVVVRLRPLDAPAEAPSTLAYLGVTPGPGAREEAHTSPPSSAQSPPRAVDGGGCCRAAGSGRGTWPLPEEYWVDRKLTAGLPPRQAHPTLLFAPADRLLPGDASVALAAAQGGQQQGGPPGAGARASHADAVTAAAGFDAWVALGLPVDWYAVGWMAEAHRRGGAAAAAASSSVPPQLASQSEGPPALRAPGGVAAAAGRTRFAVLVRGSGRPLQAEGQGQPPGGGGGVWTQDLACGLLVAVDPALPGPGGAAGGGGGVAWRLAVLPAGFAHVAVALLGGTPAAAGAVAAVGGAAAQQRPQLPPQAVDAALAAAVRALPPYYHAPLAHAVLAQQQAPSAGHGAQPRAPGGGGGAAAAATAAASAAAAAGAPLKGTRAAAVLLRLLAVAGGPQGDSGCAPAVGARQERRRREAEGDVARFDAARATGERALPHRLSVILHDRDLARAAADTAGSAGSPDAPPDPMAASRAAPLFAAHASGYHGGHGGHGGGSSGRAAGGAQPSVLAGLVRSAGLGALTVEAVSRLPGCELLAVLEAARHALYGQPRPRPQQPAPLAGAGAAAPVPLPASSGHRARASGESRVKQLLGLAFRPGDHQPGSGTTTWTPPGDSRGAWGAGTSGDGGCGGGGCGVAGSRPRSGLEAAGVGASRQVAEAIGAMGAFAPVLAARQFLRDPLDKDTGLDQGLDGATELALERRRRLAVNFASPFKTADGAAATRLGARARGARGGGTGGGGGGSGGGGPGGGSRGGGSDPFSMGADADEARPMLAPSLPTSSSASPTSPPPSPGASPSSNRAQSPSAPSPADLLADELAEELAHFAADTPVRADPLLLGLASPLPPPGDEPRDGGRLFAAAAGHGSFAACLFAPPPDPAAAAAAAGQGSAGGGGRKDANPPEAEALVSGKRGRADGAGLRLVLPPADAHRVKRLRATTASAAAAAERAPRPGSPGGLREAAASLPGGTGGDKGAAPPPPPLVPAAPSPISVHPAPALTPAVSPSSSSLASQLPALDRAPSPGLPRSDLQQQPQSPALQAHAQATGTVAAPGAAGAAGASADDDFSNLRLPEGWVVAYSRREKRHYFFNTTTNTSLWVPPPGTTPL